MEEKTASIRSMTASIPPLQGIKSPRKLYNFSPFPRPRATTSRSQELPAFGNFATLRRKSSRLARKLRATGFSICETWTLPSISRREKGGGGCKPTVPKNWNRIRWKSPFIDGNYARKIWRESIDRTQNTHTWGDAWSRKGQVLVLSSSVCPGNYKSF